MTTVLEILDRAARECSVIKPSSWVNATDLTALEIKDFLSETVDDILERVGPVSPVSQTVVITGTGVETYSLPADFKRLNRDKMAVYERFRTRRACVAVPTDGEWQYLQELGTGGAYRFYRLTGYDGAWSISFYPFLEADLTAVVSYVSRNWIINGSTYKEALTAESDVCLLPKRLVEVGIVWRFRRRKGLFYEDVKQDYEKMIGRIAADARGRQTISFGAVPARNPWDVPVPDHIPDA